MSDINHDLLWEVIMTNDIAFGSVDINKAKLLTCLCKTVSLNKNIKMSFDREKAKKYFHKIYDIIVQYLISRLRIADREKERTDDLDELIMELKEENENVIVGLRELLVLELREYIYNYEYNSHDSYDIQYNLDYCIQYNIVVYYLGFGEYFQNHTYDPKHFMITPASLYDFTMANSAPPAIATIEAIAAEDVDN